MDDGGTTMEKAEEELQVLPTVEAPAPAAANVIGKWYTRGHCVQKEVPTGSCMLRLCFIVAPFVS